MKKTLLLADDSPTIQKVINLTFADEGIDVIAVSDGNAAIQQLREMTPDLVMADVHMPGLNGYQICERLRQNAELKNVPVILLVGSFEPFDEEEAKRVGADDFLMKPFQSIRQLVGRVTALLEMDRDGEAQPEAAVTESEAETPSETGMFDAAETHAEEVPIAPAEPETETAPATDLSHAPAIEMIEDDDLANFDSEFDKKFPDAAALSSEFIDTASFTRPAEAPPYEPPAADAPGPEQTFVSPVSPDSAAMPESLPEAEEYPDESITAEQPERILDEEDIYTPAASSSPPAMPVIEETSESAFILDLGEMDAAGETPGDILDLENGEQQPVEKGIELVTDEPESVVMAEIPEIPQAAEAPEIAAPVAFEAPQYDFRNPDAFDEDADIQESFQGLAPVEETPAQVFEEPMERVVDDAEPGHVSEDQADGFSGVNTAPATVPQEAIDAATQKVLEQISEKVIRELVSGIMPDIKDLIAREIAKEND